MEKVGKDGVITVEESKSMETSLEVVEGMQFDRGYLSPYFVTDPERMEAVLEDPYILIYEKKISSMKDLLPVLEKIAQQGKPLLIVAEEVEGEALATLVVNKLRGTLKAGRGEGPRLRRPPQGHARGHRDPHRRQGHHRGPRHQARERQARRPRPAKKVTIDKDNTTIIEGAGTAKAIEGRIKQIRTQIDETTSDYDREKLQERLAKLVGGVAVIKVGAATETEMKEKKARVEDAMHATKAAVEEGIVPGGGVALLRAIPALDKALEEKGLDHDVRVGIELTRRAIEEPARWIADERRAGGQHRRRPDQGLEGGRLGLQRPGGQVREPDRGRRHRPDQGGPHGHPERLVDRRPDADHRGHRGRDPGEEEGDAGPAGDGRLLTPRPGRGWPSSTPVRVGSRLCHPARTPSETPLRPPQAVETTFHSASPVSTLRMRDFPAILRVRRPASGLQLAVY